MRPGSHIYPSQGSFVHLPAVERADVYAVHALLQDDVGFVWAATQHGLFRIDASGVKHFVHDPDDPWSLPGSFVFSLGLQSDGQLWVGTFDAGCVRFDPGSERCTPVNMPFDSGLDSLMRSVCQMSDGRVWVGTNGSLNAFSPLDHSVEKYHHPGVGSLSPGGLHHYSGLLAIDDRHLLVSTGGGMFVLDVHTADFRPLSFQSDDRFSGHYSVIGTITRMGDEVFAASFDNIYRIDLHRGLVVPLFPPLNVAENNEYFSITSLAAESDRKRLWIGTSNGLLRHDLGSDTYTLFRPDGSSGRQMQGCDVKALLIDHTGMLWVGMKEGLSLYDLRENFQLHTVPHEGESESATVTGITSVDGHLWFSTTEGLCEYDEAADRHYWYSLGGSNAQMQQANDHLLHLHKGATDLWLGSINGLFRWSPDERQVLGRYMPDPKAGTPTGLSNVMGRTVQGLLEQSNGDVWCGSDAAGIQCLDAKRGEFRYYRCMDGQEGGIPHDTLLSSLEDSRGRLWFGFVSGLARYDSQQDTFHTFLHERGNTQSLSNNVVLFLLEDSHSRIWVGTTGGLNRIEEHEDGSVTFVRFGKRQGLPDTFVSSIVEAGDDLWLGTEKGVVRFRENNGVVDARLYDMSDGLQVTSYTHDAVYRDQNGRMYFGGEGGVDVFHPDLIRGDEIPPRVVLTDLQIFNRPVSIARDERMDGTLSVDRAIAFLSELRLTHRHSVLTFHYSALHYRQPDRIRYAYMLDGFDRNWIDADTKTEATYTNLDPGDYTFRVKAMNADGVWSIQPAELALHVEPPPWRTWWAHSLYAIAGAGAIAAFTRSRIAARERELREQQRMEQARLEERESIRRQNASDFHDEAGTTLTRILFLTELARRSSNGDDELRTLLEKIDANATRLSQGMRDFIWVLDPDKDTLLDTLQRIATFGEALFAHSEATFTMQYDHQLLRGVKLDLNERRQVLMICKEALHNAARHAGAMSVMVRVRYSNDLLIITIEDDGCGFDALNGNSGYGMKSMRTRAAGVGAVLNLESLPHQGTSVELRLPQMSD